MNASRAAVLSFPGRLASFRREGWPMVPITILAVLALLAIFARTSTLPSSSESCTAVTCPILTSLYLTKVLPASMPGAASNRMVIVGPSLQTR